MTQSAIDAAIAQATANAATFNPAPAVTGAGVSTTGVTAGLPANVSTAPGAALSIDDMLSGSMDVKAWLKVSEYGMNLGSDPTMLHQFKARIRMDEIQYNFSVRYGNPARYEKTYDHVVDVKGRPWVQVLQMAQQMDPKAGEFRSADLPIYLDQEWKSTATGQVLAEAGDTLGHSISMTGWKFFQKFVRDASRAGINIHNDEITVDVKWMAQKNDSGKWGVLTFENFAKA